MGIFEILLILVFGYLLFGTNKLSELTKSVGKTIRGFKDSVNEIDVDPEDMSDDPELVERQKKSQEKPKKKN